MRLAEYMMTGKKLHEMTAEHLMQQAVLSYHEDSSGYDLATAMVNEKCGAVSIVNEEGRLVGIVTEFDLLKVLMEETDPEKVKAREIMSQPPISISIDETADKIIELLERRHLIHLPVVDKQGRLVGLIERNDVILGYLESKLGPPKSF